ncbi:aldehyde dehydrogenase family protein [Streptomyces longwoodensis]|uniref:aldehyde dehydrogenase family protein n=1 Tax=Streptomyces longwoodensis TaxID=68231 RepID=UPI0033C4FD08
MTGTSTQPAAGSHETPLLGSVIDGVAHTAGEQVEDLDPAHHGGVVARWARADAEAAEKAVVAAAEAAGRWAGTPAPLRGAVLRRAADLLEQRVTGVARDLTREEGKTVGEAEGEVKRAAAILRYFAAEALAPDGETVPSHGNDTLLYARRVPLGVVSVITPWNFPIAIPAWKIAPALAYGNAVVWKPSELTPLTSCHLASVLHEAGLPDGVLNMVLAYGQDVGDVLVAHSRVAALSFTGSTATGRRIARRAAAAMTPVQLELGGKNPAIVLADADLDHAAEQVARGAFLSTGQKCTATSRVIVENSVLSEFTDRLVTKAEAWRVGDPLDRATVLGPLASQGQYERVRQLLSSAEATGAERLTAPRRVPDDGWYMAPEVYRCDAANLLAREEVFGPVAAVFPAADFDDAVYQANDTPYGLTAALFTTDLGRALRFVDRVQAGVVKINQETAGLEFQVPFGGMRASSSGPREQGNAAREFYTQWKTVYIDY